MRDIKNIFTIENSNGKCTYEKITYNESIEEKYCYYDNKQRLIKTVHMRSESGEYNIIDSDVYTNEYEEIKIKDSIWVYHTYRHNGFALHNTITQIDNNGLNRDIASYLYNIELKEWELHYINRFDEQGHQIYEKTDYGLEWEKKYDDNGNLIMKKDIVKNFTTEYEYDEEGRVILETNSDGYREESRFKNNDLIYRKNTEGYEFKKFNIVIDGKLYEKTTTFYRDGSDTTNLRELEEKIDMRGE